MKAAQICAKQPW